jgi:hypothetical protein
MWDRTGRLQSHRFDSHGDAVKCVKFDRYSSITDVSAPSPLLTASTDKTVKYWKLSPENGKFADLMNLRGHTEKVSGVDFRSSTLGVSAGSVIYRLTALKDGISNFHREQMGQDRDLLGFVRRKICSKNCQRRNHVLHHWTQQHSGNKYKRQVCTRLGCTRQGVDPLHHVEGPHCACHLPSCRQLLDRYEAHFGIIPQFPISHLCSL